VPFVPSLQMTGVPLDTDPLEDVVVVAAAAVPAVATPPWCEHAPLPVVVLVVPSLQVTVVAACVEATAGMDTATAVNTSHFIHTVRFTIPPGC
jgi:hypothetical protein